MYSINKLLKILPDQIKFKLYIFIFLFFIASFFELLSISVLVPIAEIISGKHHFILLITF